MFFRTLFYALSLSFLSSSLLAAQVRQPGQEKPLFASGAVSPFPLHLITTCEKENETIDLGRVRVHVGDFIDFSGTNARGGTWSSVIEYTPIAGCGVYAADLDHNGTTDYVVAGLSFDSLGAYCSELVLLLMDHDGNPSPWAMRGLLKADRQGVQQLLADEQGRLLVLHDFIIGHPASRGISEAFELYRVADGKVTTVQGHAFGYDWPYLLAVNPDNVILRKIIAKNHIDVDLAPPSGTALKVLDYGPNLHQKLPDAKLTPAHAKYLRAVVDDGENYLHIAGGTALRRPVILVVQKGADRTILFHVDQTKMAQLVHEGIAVQSVGAACSAEDACHPLILWANAEK
jgi:hypothetical protein